MSGTGHYENFPVASWLCPPALRAPILAIYRYARTADDLADEGPFKAEERLAALQAYRLALNGALSGRPSDPDRWPDVFTPLQQQIALHRLPGDLLHALLDAFEQDVRDTAERRYPAHYTDLLTYCQRSANPIGRLLLHLYGVQSDDAQLRSDDICSALQLINFWQDLGQDLRRGRHYLPDDALQTHGLDRGSLVQWAQGAPADTAQAAAAQALVATLCQQARTLMLRGAPLVHQVPGRLGWELRVVVQGGLLVLDRIAAGHHRAWSHRPKLRTRDGLLLLWRAATMRGPTHCHALT